MGSICGIYRDIDRWEINGLVGTLKDTNENVYDIVVGWYDDYYGGGLSELFRESTYQNLMKGKWTLTNINAYAPNVFDIEDENGVIIEKINSRIY